MKKATTRYLVGILSGLVLAAAAQATLTNDHAAAAGAAAQEMSSELRAKLAARTAQGSERDCAMAGGCLTKAENRLGQRQKAVVFALLAGATGLDRHR